MNAVTTQKKDTAVERPQREEMYVTPEVDIFESNDAYLLEAEMPGVTKDGLELTLEEHVLTIVGHRNHEPAPGTVVYRESHAYDYRRMFELDPAIDTSKINAKMEQGILRVTLPKTERVKPRRIKVND